MKNKDKNSNKILEKKINTKNDDKKLLDSYKTKIKFLTLNNQKYKEQLNIIRANISDNKKRKQEMKSNLEQILAQINNYEQNNSQTNNNITSKKYIPIMNKVTDLIDNLNKFLSNQNQLMNTQIIQNLKNFYEI